MIVLVVVSLTVLNLLHSHQLVKTVEAGVLQRLAMQISLGVFVMLIEALNLAIQRQPELLLMIVLVPVLLIHLVLEELLKDQADIQFGVFTKLGELVL